MKRARLMSLVLLTLAVVGAGCVNTNRRTSGSYVARPRSFALAVSVQGGLQPTPAQWAAIRAKFAEEIGARGWVLVTDVTLADHIVRIDFTPDPDDPESSGHARIISIKANPQSMVARRGNSPFSNAYSYAYGGLWNPYSMQYGYYPGNYYGYGDFYGYDATYGGGSATYVPVTHKPTPTHPPYRHPPGNRDDCPPEQGIRPLTGTFAGNYTSNPVNDHPRTPPSDYRRGDRGAASSRNDRSSSGDRGYARSDSWHGRSDSSYARSDSSSSYSNSSYSRSDSSSTRNDAAYFRSESSYSAPVSYSSSSDSYSASSSSSAAASSAAASFSSAVSTAETTSVAKQN